ncbi:MAG: DUF1491 family protein [Alphaproteobacteria bacterium]|nr:DUF1491 family protein [Alphaproteobacteria bacterium]
MRLKTEIIVAAELKRAQSLGLFATILHKGDANAGQIYIVLNKNNNEFLLIGPPFGTSIDDEGQKIWHFPLGELSISLGELDEYLNKIRKFDPDIYVLEIEDKTLEYRPTGILPSQQNADILALKQQADDLFKS